MGDTVHARAPDLAAQLARFNEERKRMCGGVPPTPEEPLPLEPTGVGGDVKEPCE